MNLPKAIRRLSVFLLLTSLTSFSASAAHKKISSSSSRSTSSFSSPSSQKSASEIWVTLSKDTAFALTKAGFVDLDFFRVRNGIVLAKIKESRLDALSSVMHTKLHIRGGFITHENFSEAMDTLDALSKSPVKNSKDTAEFNYTIDQEAVVTKFVSKVDESFITEIVNELSTYRTRHYKTTLGQESQQMLADLWKKMAKDRDDISVEMFSHKRSPQNSVILTVKGTQRPDEVVVLGGHGDSIVSSGGVTAIAPGADDNASGIAVLSEVLRLIIANDYKPARTVKIISYAAEEGGLIGSMELAKDFRAKKINVVGVMQLDMTNYKGSKEIDISLIGDLTNEKQNKFLGNLIDKYVQVKWGYSECGYGCSDHASWTRNAYPSSFPFEASSDEINPYIHTSKDTLDVTKQHSYHSVPFAKLASAFVVEMAKK